jgi:hypothetical protein
MKIQGCRVESWTSNEGAIVLGHRGPTTLFDCVFEKPPGTGAPVRLANPKEIQQLLILSNCANSATRGVLDKGPNSRITEVPAGNRQTCLGPPSLHAFQHSPPFGGKCFDAIRDFGAKADSVHDDTSALQKGIDAARAEGKNAVFYLPSGTYRFSHTLKLTGANYFVSGTGHASILEWVGAKSGTMIEVRDPRAITLEHLNLRGSDSTTRIHHTASGPSAIFYDGIYTNGADWTSKDCQGLWCDKLPDGAVVRIGQFVGNIRLTDCGRATIVCAVHYYSLKLDGATQPKTGIAGFMFHNDAAHNYALEVLDNQDVLIADFYSEANKRFLLCSGSENQPSGHVTIGCSKMSPTESECITIRDYQGRIFIGGGDSYNPSHWGQALNILHEGNRSVDFVIAGQGWWAVEPQRKFGPGLRYIGVENLLMENKYPEYSEKSLPNVQPAGADKTIILALDHFRELAESYLKLFYS